MRFYNSILAEEQSIYGTEIINAYVVYDFDTWPKTPLNNFNLKNCLLGSTNIVKNSDKGKLVDTGYGIAFDGAGWWSFGNDFARNAVMFGVDNSSSSHADNCKNSFLVLSEVPTDDINGSVGAA